ncbi:MAG: efflux RND transporter periplasmic adaptor subunit [Pseudomonadota bacterium]
MTDPNLHSRRNHDIRKETILLRINLMLLATLLMSACNQQDEASDDDNAPIRGLVTTQVASTERSTVRRYPGVLEPTEITSLSFEVAGKLEALDLSVGQRVSRGDVLAKLDDTQFLVEIGNRKASVEEAAATLAQDEDDLARQQTLLESGTVTRVAVDEAETDFKTSRARMTQAEEALKSAEENLADSLMTAPFDGIINSVDADSFATVASGTTITSLYDASSYEVSFSVNFDTVARLVVGTTAKVRLADDPDSILEAVVSELGERADTVSSFPVIVEVKEVLPIIKAGMAVEVSFEFNLPAEEGYLLPISAAIADGQIPEGAGSTTTTPLAVFVFDPQTSTVKRREVVMAGIRENKFLIIKGLEPGEHVATAGVSFLREGMQVKLLKPEE